MIFTLSHSETYELPNGDEFVTFNMSWHYTGYCKEYSLLTSRLWQTFASGWVWCVSHTIKQLVSGQITNFPAPLLRHI